VSRAKIGPIICHISEMVPNKDYYSHIGTYVVYMYTEIDEFVV